MAEPMPVSMDHVTSRLRRVEARVAAMEDAISVYGPPDNRPIFSLRVPRVATLTGNQTRLLVYALFLSGIGIYTLAKFKANESL